MTTQTTAQAPEGNKEVETFKRRGLFAAAAALVAAVVAKVTEQPVLAGVDGDVVLGATNTTANVTRIDNTTPNSQGFSGSCTASTDGVGVFGAGSGFGCVGIQTGAALLPDGAAVLGLGSQPGGYGVLGVNGASAAPAVGVRGESQHSEVAGIGVFGQGNGNGMFGQLLPGSTANGIAIYAWNNSSFAGAGPGGGGFGVYGLSQKGHGLVGATATAGGAAVAGATNGVAGAYAGLFYGPVIVSGPFTVFGGPKSAAVPHPDGSHRRLYCVESPESWFEDFGNGRLEGGCASVVIDPDFAAVVNLTEYHVFLTDYTTRQQLSVTARTPRGFTVEANSNGIPTASSEGDFGWRIVAKRKDIAAPRFETVTVPPEPTLPSIPEVPAAVLPPMRPAHG
jgi:hypothetical protein